MYNNTRTISIREDSVRSLLPLTIEYIVRTLESASSVSLERE